MSLLGLDTNIQDQIFSILAAILHIGNLQFKEQGSGPISFANPEGMYNHFTVTDDFLVVVQC